VRALVVSHVYADPAARGKLRALAGLGVAVTAAVPERWLPAGGGPPQQTTWSDDALVQVAPIAVRGSLADPSLLRWQGAALRRLASEFRPDLVQIEEEPWTGIAGLATRIARKLRAPTVLAPLDSLARGGSIVQRLRRDRTIAAARGVLAANRLALTLATRHRADVPHRILPRLGVQPPVMAPREPHAGLAIGFLGRLVPQRGLDLLFRACVGLLGEWTITVVGTGPSQEELEGLAERLGIAARVTWLGPLPRPAVQAVWPRLDCVVVPSRTTPRWVETVGRAAVDAMAHGLAVVGSTSGVLPEVIGDAGRTVPEDDVAALGAVLQELHADASLRERLGAAGRRRVMEELSDPALARKTLEFWTGLMGATA